MQTQSILRKLKRNRLEIKRVIESSSLEVIASLVECGAGLGILPTRVAKAHSSSLVAVKGAPTFDDEIMLIYRTEYRSVRAIRELSESIQRGFASSRR